MFIVKDLGFGVLGVGFRVQGGGEDRLEPHVREDQRDEREQPARPQAPAPLRPARRALQREQHLPQRELFIDNPMVRFHLIIVMILVDRPCAMGVLNSLFQIA